MKITKDTKISRLLKEDDDMLDLIVSISPVFRKLSNPFFRRNIAPRVTVKDAARIGGITPNAFLRRLAEAGYEVELDPDEQVDVIPKKCDLLQRYRIRTIDVRPLLAKGEDPFMLLKKELDTLAEDEALEVLLDFEPFPLIELFSRDGFEHCTRCDRDGTVHTFFFKPLPKKGFWQKLKSFLGMPPASNEQEKSATNAIQVSVHGEDVFDEKRRHYEGRLRHIDVRGLEMPQPMMNILEALGSLGEDEALLVDHERIPQYLLPELEKRNMEIAVKNLEPGHVQLIIYKK